MFGIFEKNKSKTGGRNEKVANGMRAGNGFCVLYVRMQFMSELVSVCAKQRQGRLRLLRQRNCLHMR